MLRSIWIKPHNCTNKVPCCEWVYISVLHSLSSFRHYKYTQHWRFLLSKQPRECASNSNCVCTYVYMADYGRSNLFAPSIYAAGRSRGGKLLFRSLHMHRHRENQGAFSAAVVVNLNGNCISLKMYAASTAAAQIFKWNWQFAAAAALIFWHTVLSHSICMAKLGAARRLWITITTALLCTRNWMRGNGELE